MESVIPAAVQREMSRRSAARRRPGPSLVAVSGTGPRARRHPVVELSETGLVIRAAGTPHLTGYVDILRGSERIGRHLVVLSWARNGMAGYEFKLGAQAGDVAADYVRPDHRGLLGGPSRRR